MWTLTVLVVLVCLCSEISSFQQHRCSILSTKSLGRPLEKAVIRSPASFSLMIAAPGSIPTPSATPANAAKAGLFVLVAVLVNYQSKLIKIITTGSTRANVVKASLVVIAALCIKFQKKIARKVEKEMTLLGASMEDGWTKRGKNRGGGFTRSLEVWVFAISFLIKYVRLVRMSVNNTFLDTQ